MSIKHRIAHWLGWNVGHAETWWDGPDDGPMVLMAGFRCSGCGRLSSVHEIPRSIFP